MPTVMRIGRYRFFFYSNENDEPTPIPIRAGSEEAKFWLLPVALETNHGFRMHEINEIERLVQEHQPTLMEAWNEYFTAE